MSRKINEKRRKEKIAFKLVKIKIKMLDQIYFMVTGSLPGIYTL